MNKDIILNELKFKAVRSSGSGGQHVNKVSSKVMVFFNINQSNGFNEEEKELLLKKLESKLNKKAELIVSCDESRSQFENKDKAVTKLFEILSKSLIKKKKRKATKPTKASKIQRLDHKSKLSIKKELRKKPKI